MKDIKKKPLTERIKKVATPLSHDIAADFYSRSEDDRYWSIQEIAEYIGMSETTVRRSFINDPRWPNLYH